MSCRRRRSRQAAGDFGHKPVGSGAYKMAEWTLGQRLVLEKNADYWKPDTPKLDKITFEFGQEPNVALLRLQRGEVDVLGDGIPPAQFLEVKDDPQYAGQIVEGGQLHTGYVTMNVNTKPFDDVRVRQAVNMAINKDRIVRIINNRAVPANQPLPPSMPGYIKDLKGYRLRSRGGEEAPRRRRPRRRLRRPSSTSTTPTPTRASPRRSSRTSRRSASRPSSSRWPRPTSSTPAATARRR